MIEEIIQTLGSFKIGQELNDKLFEKENKKILLETILKQEWKDFMLFLSQNWVNIYQKAKEIYNVIEKRGWDSVGTKRFQWLLQKQKESYIWFEENKDENLTTGFINLSGQNFFFPPIQLSVDKALGKNIKVLVMNHNKLLIVPQQLVDNMPDLEQLGLLENYLGTMPDLKNSKINWLNLSCNVLTVNEIKNLPPLVINLILCNLALKQIPAEILTLKNLMHLNMESNQITTIFLKNKRNAVKEIIMNNPYLIKISLDDNPLEGYKDARRAALEGSKVLNHRQNRYTIRTD